MHECSTDLADNLNGLANRLDHGALSDSPALHNLLNGNGFLLQTLLGNNDGLLNGLCVQTLDAHDALILSQHDIANLLVADIVTKRIDVCRPGIGVVSEGCPPLGGRKVRVNAVA